MLNSGLSSRFSGKFNLNQNEKNRSFHSNEYTFLKLRFPHLLTMGYFDLHRNTHIVKYHIYIGKLAEELTNGYHTSAKSMKRF